MKTSDDLDSMPRRVLVTGGMGFIGSAVIRHMIADLGWSVLNVDKLTYAGDVATVAAVADDERHRHSRTDICDREAVQALIDEFRPDAIVHLAAETHVDRSIQAPEAFVRTNLTGTYVMLDVALGFWRRLPDSSRNVFRFLHVSTDEVYGSLPLEGGRPFREDTAYAPNSPYAASKAGADHLARAWHRTFGLPVIVSNCSNNYGPYQFPEKLIPLTIARALLGRSLPVYGTGDNVRDWLYVEDHARALTTILKHGAPGQSYNVAGGNQSRNIDLVHALCAVLDAEIPDSAHLPHQRLIRFVEDRPGHDLRYALDDSKIRAELGWRPRESLESGLRRTVQWYIGHPDWWQRLMRDRYDGNRIGLASATAAKRPTTLGEGDIR